MKNAIGQFILYRNVLAKLDPERELFLAIRQATYEDVFAEPLGKLLIENEKLQLIVFDPGKRVVVQWIR